jgi:hypothetical protein
MVDSIFTKRSSRLDAGNIHQELRLIIFVAVSILLGSAIREEQFAIEHVASLPNDICGQGTSVQLRRKACKTAVDEEPRSKMSPETAGSLVLWISKVVEPLVSDMPHNSRG